MSKNYKERFGASMSVMPDVTHLEDRPTLPQTRRFTNARIIPIDQIFPDPEQPRKSKAEHKFEELMESIKVHGLLQPITVEQMDNISCCLFRSLVIH